MNRLITRMMRLLVNRRRWDLLLPLLAGPAALLPGVGLGLALFGAFVILFVRLLADAAGQDRLAEPLFCGLIAGGVVILRGALLAAGPFLAVALGFAVALSDQHPGQYANALLIGLFAGGLLVAHVAPLGLLHALRRPLARALDLDETGRPLAVSCLILALMLAALALGAIGIWLAFGEAGFLPAMLLLFAVEAATWTLYAVAATPDPGERAG